MFEGGSAWVERVLSLWMK